jgi:hypothetical protein
MKIPQEKPAFEACVGCGVITRVWRFEEELIDFGIGLGVVDGRGLCRACIPLYVAAATVEDDPDSRSK